MEQLIEGDSLAIIAVQDLCFRIRPHICSMPAEEEEHLHGL
jgi:hypothetical protein